MDDKFKDAPKPGYLYDVSSGMYVGLASYEQAEQFRKSGGQPLCLTYAGCPVRYTIKQEKP